MSAPSRRNLMTQAALLAGAALVPAAWTSAPARARMEDDVFSLGVASGEPEPDGFVIWTRLAIRPMEPDGGMGPEPVRVGWVVAEDAGLKRLVAQGRTLAVAEAAHSVHVEVAGLKPGREYWYRFTAAGQASQVGRAMTTPPRGSSPERLKLAYGSCQKYEAGYYSAHAALAADAPDLVLFLGDYIYEGPMGLGGVRRHQPFPAMDLASYRTRYGQYKSDPNLKAAHAVAPWMTIWDDHEVSNDYGDDQDRFNPDPANFLRRRAAAYQAYYEHMPLRRRSLPVGPQMQLYRRLVWGDLAEFQFLDTRQYRDHRTCEAASQGKRIAASCPERDDPARSLLGSAQEKWLSGALSGSHGRWNILAQQYFMGELLFEGDKVSNDAWDGYSQTRRRVLETWRDLKTANPLALGGDIHCFLAGELALERGAAPIATEFVGGSFTSEGKENAALAEGMIRNPHLKYAEGELHGYGRVAITPKAAEVTFRAAADVRVPDSPVRDIARFVVESGRPGVHRA